MAAHKGKGRTNTCVSNNMAGSRCVWHARGAVASGWGAPWRGAGTALVHLLRCARLGGGSPLRACLITGGLLPLSLCLMAMDKTDRVLGLAFLCQIAYGGLDSDKVAETVEDFFGEAVDGEGLAGGGSSCTPFQHMLLSATLDRLSWHRGEGHLVVLLSASPAHITIPLGRVLGVDIVAAAPCPTVEMSSKEGGKAVEKEGRGRRKVFSRCMYGDTVSL